MSLAKSFFIFIIVLFHCLPVLASQLSEYAQVKCIIHIHTDISSGTKALESYVEEAREEGIGAIVFTDDDWQRWEYGLPLLRRVIKKVSQKKSVMTFGIEKYLTLIKEMNEKYKDLIIIDGVQTNPFYYWSGNFFKGTFALNNRNKDMLVVGFGNANDYRNMPLVANYKSKFDAYHGDKFTLPYQDLIDYVIEKGGLIFWSHPEYAENTLKDGIRLLTVPYQWDLVGTYNYTGFGIFPAGHLEIGKPGGIWDRILAEYCQGRRKLPVWAIGELEESGLGNKNLDDIVNVVYVKKFDRQQILDAFRKGRFYVTYKEFDRVPLVLEEFTVSNEAGTPSATMGEEVVFSGDPLIKIRISHEQSIDKDITVRLIRDRKIIEEFSGKSEMKIEYKDQGLLRNQKHYYRLEVISHGNSSLISNPIFFNQGLGRPDIELETKK